MLYISWALTVLPHRCRSYAFYCIKAPAVGLPDLVQPTRRLLAVFGTVIGLTTLFKH
jgi:hypothetical protein